jgi:hypothetical protein
MSSYLIFSFKSLHVDLKIYLHVRNMLPDSTPDIYAKLSNLFVLWNVENLWKSLDSFQAVVSS